MFPSLYGKLRHWHTRGSHVAHAPTRTGFRRYVVVASGGGIITPRQVGQIIVPAVSFFLLSLLLLLLFLLSFAFDGV
jgi:hypothetical protein